MSEEHEGERPINKNGVNDHVFVAKLFNRPHQFLVDLWYAKHFCAFFFIHMLKKNTKIYTVSPFTPVPRGSPVC
jgi:hypothetical protein